MIGAAEYCAGLLVLFVLVEATARGANAVKAGLNPFDFGCAEMDEGGGLGGREA